MANSSWFSTSNTYIKYRIEVTTNSQDQAGNYSNVTVKVWCYRTNSGFETYGSGTCYCEIDGATYSQAITSSQKITDAGLYLFSKTLNVPHAADGTKALVCSAMIDHSRFTSSYNSYTETLTSIARASAVAFNGTELNSNGTITITKADAAFTHTLTYTCGSASGTIATKTASSALTWKPPLSLASQNTSGSSVTVTISCTAYSGDTQLGTTTTSKTLSIPSSCVPTCALSISDTSGCYGAYGIYVQGKSQLQITVTPTLSYGSAIAAYEISANGRTYTSTPCLTDLLTSSGTATITATVTDGRGRTGSASKEITVYAYEVPLINSLTVTRCNSDGTDNFEGAYVRVEFSCTITPLNNHNTAAYQVAYKKTTASNYNYVDLTGYAGNYSPTGQTIIAMSADYSYDVVFSAEDAFTTSSKRTTASTGFALINWGSDGKSLGFGKLASHPNQVDIGLAARFTGGIAYIELPNDADLNEVITTGFYIGNASLGGYSHCPINAGMFALEVMSIGTNGQLSQAVTVSVAAVRTEYRRIYQSNAWSAWIDDGGFISVARGGTGLNAVPSGALLTGDTASALATLLGVGALYSSQSGNPVFGTLPVEMGGTSATTAAGARASLGAAATGHTHTIDSIDDIESGSGYFKIGGIYICFGRTDTSSMSGAKTMSIPFSHFTNAPIVVVSPYCTTSAASGYAMGAYVLSVSASSASIRVSSNYTGSLTIRVIWIAIGT